MSKRNENKLIQILSFLSLYYSNILEEFPGLIEFLDSGKQILIPKNTKNFNQKILILILENLPVVCKENSIWMKENSNSLKKFLFLELLNNEIIKQPKDLFEYEILALKSSKIIQNILQNNQNILEDLITLLNNLNHGEGIDLSGLDNIQIRNDLDLLFTTLGIETNHENIYLLTGNKKLEIIKKAIKILISSLKVNKPHELETLNSFTTLIENDNNNNNNDNRDSSSNFKREVEEKNQYIQNYLKQYEEESSDDDDNNVAGPTPNQQIEIISNSSNLTNEKYTPLSSLDYVDSNNIHPQSSSQELSQFPQSQSQQSVNVNVREEWLLTPGERKPFGESFNGIMLNNRKFERGKQSKKDAEALNEENERLYTAYLQSEEGQKTEAMLQEYKAKRGPSLMESHLENNSKKKRNESSEYQFFDRDRDMLSHRKMDKYQVNQLVENAKQLDSRFSKTAVQKSFL